MGENSYDLRLTPKASDDLDEIYEYIPNNLHNLKAAVRLMSEMETNLLRLKDFPLSGSLRNDEFLRKKGYRKLIVENYIVFYLVNESEKQVVVMRVLYGSRKYENLI